MKTSSRYIICGTGLEQLVLLNSFVSNISITSANTRRHIFNISILKLCISRVECLSLIFQALYAHPHGSSAYNESLIGDYSLEITVIVRLLSSRHESG